MYIVYIYKEFKNKNKNKKRIQHLAEMSVWASSNLYVCVYVCVCIQRINSSYFHNAKRFQNINTNPKVQSEKSLVSNQSNNDKPLIYEISQIIV